MGFVERVNEIEIQLSENNHKKNEINKKLKPLYAEKNQIEDGINSALNTTLKKKTAKLTALKTIMIIILVIVTGASMLLIYQNYPFGEPVPTSKGSETYSMFGFVCIVIIHLVVLIVGILIINNAQISTIEEDYIV